MKSSAIKSKAVRERLVFSICLACMFLFLYTASSKLLGHDRFLKGLSKNELTARFALYIAWLVPVSEIAVAVLLVFPRTYKWGLYWFAALMILFTGYIISMLLWAKKLPCHCGGAIEKLSWAQHIWFNLVFIAIAVFALWLSRSTKKLKI